MNLSKLTNTVHYYLYSIDFDDIIEKNDDNQKLLFAENLIKKYQQYLNHYLKDYIWHNEGFHLKPIIIQSENYIYGRCNYEDNVEDEWFIFFLLKELTKFDSNLFIQVQDEDGEFLLIESALYLENWAQEPKHTENRVFLFNDELHLVSPKLLKNNQNIPKSQFVKKCIDFIRKYPNKTRCNDSIKNCLNQRIQDYPVNISKWHHNAHCHLPRSIAAILHQYPQLISPAVRAFFYRTPDDCKYINRLKHFKWENLITSNIKFTRCLFAQLSSQEFIDSEMIHLPKQDSKEYSIYSNGAKITAGFEILIRNYEKNKLFIDENVTNSCNDFEDNATCFEKNLSIAGKQIYEILQNPDSFQSDHFLENPLSPADDESWMNVNAEQLDKLLKKKFDPSYDSSKPSGSSLINEIPEIISKFFENQKAGLDGAEPPQSSTTSGVSKKTKSSKKIDCDEKDFFKFMNQIKSMSLEQFQNLDNCDDDIDSDIMDEDEEYEDESSKSPEIEAYMMQMDKELAQRMLSSSFEKAPLDSDDSDEEQQIKFNTLTNIFKSIEEETLQGIGPASTLYAFMNRKLPSNLNEKDNLTNS